MAKKLPNKELNENFQSTGIKTYGDLMAMIVRTPGQNGVQVDEMRKAIKIADIAENAGDEIFLEDDQHRYLRDKTKNMPFRFVDEGLVQFMDDLEAAEEVSLNKKG
jgi:hypothetical protein